MTEETGMSIQTTCAKCWQSLEFFGERCTECQEAYDTNQTVLAHDLVDEGNMQYRKQWLITTEPSAHDWVAPLTRTPKGEREEFLEPTTNLADRPFEPSDEAMVALVTLGADEAVCNWCHLTFLARRVSCPDCAQADA
jgi:predicted amidophosphoribosyltransferase